MKCIRVRRLLIDYVEDVVSSRKREAIEHHLSHCEDCEKELRAIEKTMEEVFSCGTPERDSEFWERFNTRLSQRLADQISGTASQRLPIPGFSVAGIAAAAMVILISVAIVYRYWETGKVKIESSSQPRLAESADSTVFETEGAVESLVYEDSTLALSYLSTEDVEELASELVIPEESVYTMSEYVVLNGFYEPTVDDFIDEMSEEEIDTLYEDLEII